LQKKTIKATVFEKVSVTEAITMESENYTYCILPHLPDFI